jgi:hypothetical protein
MHLNTEVALNFLEGRLDKEQEAFWKRHVDACADCAQDVRRWQELGINLERSHLRSASDQDLQNVVNLFQLQPKEVTSLRSILAAIVFDSFLQPAMAGARGSSTTSRQLVMRADEFDIHIKIWSEGDRREMLGQLLSRSDPEFTHTARFHLLRNGEKIESTITDELGEFHFSDIPEGNLSLQMDLPNLTVIGALTTREAS